MARPETLQGPFKQHMLLPTLIGTEHWLNHAKLPQRLAVGYSGGADSTALLLALAAKGLDVVAWHVDHGWHAGSGAVAGELELRAASWGIEFHQARVQPRSDKNREAEARKARFEQFSLWAAEQRITTLCLAQQRDDQAETVCMRLLQGAGPSGCAGMRERRMRGDLHIMRPLLHIGRAELIRVLDAAGIDWHEDASNSDTTLLRNHIRHDLFPAVREKGINPADLFCRWQVQAQRLSARLNQLADKVPLALQQGIAVVDWEAWRSSPQAVRALLLQRMSASLFGEGTVLGRRHILLAEAWRRQGGRQGIDLSRCRLFRSRESLHLAPATVSLPHRLR